jgi:DNA-binding XRE family transcriptional regulator
MKGFKMNQVKTLRKMRNLRQIEVAEGADVAISTLWMIEKGFDKKTSYETKKKLADFFEVSLEDLFPFQGQKK